MALRELSVRASDLEGAALTRRVDHRGELIGSLVHRRLERAHQIGLLAERGAVRERLDVNVAPAHEPDAHPFARQHGGKLGRHRGRGGLEMLVVQRSRDQLEHGDEARLARKSLAARERFQPADPPAERLDQLAQGRFGTAFDLERGCAIELVVDQDRMRDEDDILPPAAVLRALDGDPLLRQRLFHHRGELRAALDAFGPESDGCEGRRFRGAQHHRAADHPAESAALRVEPARGK